MSSDYLLINEAASYLRIAPSTLYGWVHERKIPCRKHGGRVVFFRPDLDVWSEEKKVDVRLQDSFSTSKNYAKFQLKPRNGRSLTTEQKTLESLSPNQRG